MDKLSEQDIRPSELMTEQKVAMLTDVGRMLSKYDEFVYVACPACGTDESVPKYKKNGISYVDCKICNTFYVNPRPTPSVLEWFYKESPNYAYWNKVVFPATEDTRRKKIFVPRVDRLIELCKKYSVETNSILEVGAGFGTFCSEIESRKIFEKVVAVEPTTDLAETCRKRGLEVIEKPIEQIQLDNSELFDVVASFEVIEHLFDPNKFIGDMVNLLKFGGLIIITCPNGEGFDVETLGEVSDTVDHEHLNYFNPHSLAKLLEANNLKVLESFTPGLLDGSLVRNKILSEEFDVSKQPFLKKLLIDDWEIYGQPFQEFLVQQGLSSNMWMVARKNCL